MHGRYTKSNHLFPGFEYFTDLKVLSLTEVDIAMGWKPNTAEIGLFWMRLSCLRISRYLIQTMCLEEEGKKNKFVLVRVGFSRSRTILLFWSCELQYLSAELVHSKFFDVLNKIHSLFP